MWGEDIYAGVAEISERSLTSEGAGYRQLSGRQCMRTPAGDKLLGALAGAGQWGLSPLSSVNAAGLL